MDKYKFLNALSNSQYLDKIDVQQLNEIVESFPYFQSAYLLLAQKIIHQPQLDQTSVTLPCIASHIGDREMLYKIWNPTEYALKQGAFSNTAFTSIKEEAQKFTSPPELFPDSLSEEVIEVGEEFATTDSTAILEPALQKDKEEPAEKNNSLGNDQIDELLKTIKEEEETENIVQDLLQKSDQELDRIIDTSSLSNKGGNEVTPINNEVQASFEDEEALLSTGEISEKARKQVEIELQRQLEHPEEATENTSDTANLTAIITQEVREIIQQDIEKDLKKLKRKRGKEISNDEELINKSIEKPTALMQTLQEKVETHKQTMGFDNTLPQSVAPIDTDYNDNDIDQELLLQLQGKVDAYKQTTVNSNNEADNENKTADYSETSESVESLLDEFEEYKKKREQFSTIATPKTNEPVNEVKDSLTDKWAGKEQEEEEKYTDTNNVPANKQPYTPQDKEVEEKEEQTTLESIKNMFSTKIAELKETVSEHTEQLSDKIDEVKDSLTDKWADKEQPQAEEQQPQAEEEQTTLESIKNMFSTKIAELKETVSEHTEQLSDKIDELMGVDGEEDKPAKSVDAAHSELSVTREGVVLSEMMAKVYIKQGQYGKAVQIYEQLSLEYPEKSAYFAAKIQALKK